MERNDLTLRQRLPLADKEALTTKRIREWYDHFGGMVYVAFSGGKDSTVLLHQVRRIYPEVPAVFCDTGLEYPEVRDFVKTIDGVVWVRPRMPFGKVIEKYGYPVISKDQAGCIARYRNTKSDQMRYWRINGFPRGTKGTISKKWQFMLNAPFKISDKCCEMMKKQPLDNYTKASGRYPITGMMASDSKTRQDVYLRQGCNPVNNAKPVSSPMAFWLEEDVWAYIKAHDVPYSKIYDMGETRTGCMFCMFGIHKEGSPNRFQRMQKTHPKQWAYCMDKLKIREVLGYMGLPACAEPDLFSLTKETEHV